jgi:hypothetical protein
MREVMGIPPVERKHERRRKRLHSDLSLRRPLLVVGLLSATCWFVVRQRMLRPDNFPFNGRSITARHSTA